ncbi:MAG: hypothetical protein KKC79_15920 [Gammaproteobacteria bacterium]|nr:hypothetical protein [Gammaproteobacteria bacterium]MBU1440112.1 hypothetical protein [Gammaproteobacteria bacterium]MBU2410123.1 hypothetical protein [Gammaproteobacteria bacterium]
MPKVILLRVDAPPKPAVGQACNGCGVCCTSEPCPVGAILSRRLHGACAVLEFSEDAGRYHCGLITDPVRWLPRALHGVAPWVSKVARRFIAAGRGCDSSVEVQNA